jgi:MYXO-CTERM domain-containing protein
MVWSLLKRLSGLGIVVGLALGLAPGSAWAHKNGIASEGCNGCHSGGVTPTVTVTSSAPMISPGQTLTLSVNITTPEGYAGLFMITDVGTLTSLAGQGTQLLSGGITHTAPKKAVNGVTTFAVGWTAPTVMGGVNVNVWVVAANGDGTQRGDGPGDGFGSFAIGCAGTTYYRDFDGDGYGGPDSGYTVNCALPKYYATKQGDCDDSNAMVYPGAPEICNMRDDNCNGLIDEGLPILTCHVDMDGDGHGTPGGMTVMGCACPKGYAPNADDCNDNDPTIYPGAPEICDYKDNNCNGQVDEGARSSCGLGWCRRLGDSCDSTSCTPGAPRPETCNAFDDDCDGVIDNGTDAQLCGNTGLHCLEGTCVKPGTVLAPDGGSDPDAGNGSGTGDTGLSGTGAGIVMDPGQDTGAGGDGRTREAAGCDVAAGSASLSSPAVGALGVLVALALVRRRRRARVTAADRPS